MNQKVNFQFPYCYCLIYYTFLGDILGEFNFIMELKLLLFDLRYRLEKKKKTDQLCFSIWQWRWRDYWNRKCVTEIILSGASRCNCSCLKNEPVKWGVRNAIRIGIRGIRIETKRTKIATGYFPLKLKEIINCNNSRKCLCNQVSWLWLYMNIYYTYWWSSIFYSILISSYTDKPVSFRMRFFSLKIKNSARHTCEYVCVNKKFHNTSSMRTWSCEHVP